MDDDLNFSDGAGATPGSNSILAQPPLQGDSPEQSGQGESMVAASWIKEETDFRQVKM